MSPPVPRCLIPAAPRRASRHADWPGEPCWEDPASPGVSALQPPCRLGRGVRPLPLPWPAWALLCWPVLRVLCRSSISPFSLLSFLSRLTLVRIHPPPARPCAYYDVRRIVQQPPFWLASSTFAPAGRGPRLCTLSAPSSPAWSSQAFSIGTLSARCPHVGRLDAARCCSAVLQRRNSPLFSCGGDGPASYLLFPACDRPRAPYDRTGCAVPAACGRVALVLAPSWASAQRLATVASSAAASTARFVLVEQRDRRRNTNTIHTRTSSYGRSMYMYTTLLPAPQSRLPNGRPYLPGGPPLLLPCS